MTDSADQHSESLFYEVIGLPSGERGGFLEANCTGDPVLRADVEELLRMHEKTPAFLPTDSPVSPALTASFTRPVPVAAGEWIGPYQLLAPLGEGGFGAVWVAHQDKPVRRQVALKIIKLGMDTREVLARFEQERKALSLMDHVHIAKVLDAGATDAGRPYFVMELVRGLKITEFCDDQRHSTEARLRLFTKVCQAVEHAHQKGIIHRDLKPSNILVSVQDGIPVPMVIDFGVAKATQHSPLADLTFQTRIDQLVGTPLYMSPEQADQNSQDIDTRSDIYSLGVLLYELLTGQTPFDPNLLVTRNVEEFRRVVREQEPPTPSSLLGALGADRRAILAQYRGTESSKHIDQVHGDLDWIVMKALEKDRTRRYDTATDLAQDIQRHLASEPVDARAPTSTYRFCRFARRNRIALGAAAGIAASLVLGLGFAYWMFYKERAARQQAVTAEEAQRWERQKATTEAAKSRHVTQLLEKMLSGVAPEVAQGADTRLLRKIMERAVSELATNSKYQPEVEAELRGLIGSVYGALADYNQARSMLEQALAITRRLHGTDHPEVVEMLDRLGAVLRGQGHLKESESVISEAIGIQKHLNHADISSPLNNLALTLSAGGEYTRAESILREALTLRRNALGGGHQDVALLLANLAAVLDEQGKFEEAEMLLHEAITNQKRYWGNEHPDVAATLNTLAAVVQRQDKFEESESLFREVLALQRKLLGDAHPNVAAALNGLALALHKQGKDVEAEPLLREGVRIEMAARQTAHPQTARLIGNLGRILQGLQKFDEADLQFREALDICSRLSGTEHPDAVQWRNRLLILLQDQGKWPEMEVMLRETLAIHRAHTTKAKPDIAATLVELARILENQNKLQEAKTAYEDALAAFRELPGEETATADILEHLAVILNRQNRHSDAEPYIREAVDLNRRLLSSGDPLLVRQIGNLGIILEAQGKFAESELFFREALDMSNKSRPTGSNGVNPWVLKLDGVLERQGKLPEQETLIRELLEQSRNLELAKPQRVEGQAAMLAENLYRQGKFAEAESFLREVIRSMKARLGEGNEMLVDHETRLARLLADWAWSERPPLSVPQERKPQVVDRAREAEHLMRRGLDVALGSRKPDPIVIAEFRSRLGAALVAVAATDASLPDGDRVLTLTTAEELLLAAVKALNKPQQGGKRFARDSCLRLIRLYEIWNRPDQAALWQQELTLLQNAIAESATIASPRIP